MTQDEVKQHTQEKGESQKDTGKPSHHFSGWVHGFISRYWPNIITGVILLFIGIPVVLAMSTRKGAIYATAIAICLFVCLIVFSIAHHFANQEPEAPAKIGIVEQNETPTITSNGLSEKPPLPPPLTQAPKEGNKPMSKHDDQPNSADNSNDRSKSHQTPPSISQTMTDSPGGVQAINSNVTVHPVPLPRHITAEQSRIFVGILSTRPKAQINISCPVGDSEACNLASQLESLLKAGGWTVIGNFQVALKKIPTGIRIIAKNPGIAPPTMQALAEAFHAVGFQVDPRFDTELSDDLIGLLVGTRP